MKIAIATRNFKTISEFAGQTHEWLLYDCVPGQPIPEPEQIELNKEQLPHHFKDDGPHPLHGVDIAVAGSAGGGYIRHMARWGTQVMLTGESDPSVALERILAGEALPDPRASITSFLCKLHSQFLRP